MKSMKAFATIAAVSIISAIITVPTLFYVLYRVLTSGVVEGVTR